MNIPKSSHFWLACDVKEGDRHYAFALRVSENDNLKCRLEGIQNLYAANIMPGKKRAAEVVTTWNDAYKANGKYLFSEPQF